MSKALSSIILLTFLLTAANAQNIGLRSIAASRINWVDSVFHTLTEEQKISQLIMVPAWSNRDIDHLQELEYLVREFGIGGIAFFQGGPIRQINMINHLQSISKVPMIMGLDAEWGLNMRLDSTMQFPYQIALGAIQDNSLIYEMGRAIGRQLKSVGIQMNFAPVVDVNNNPLNPVINYRSFGSDPENVAAKGVEYMKGLQDENIIPTAKHFPGHGDTQTDSHFALPLIKHDIGRLKEVELFPFKELINKGLAGIMVAHLNIPELDPEYGIATSISYPVITGLLKEEMNFEGIIVTDALNMKGVADYFQPGELEVRAFLAGNDILVYIQDVEAAVKAIKSAIINGRIKQEDIDSRCRKILALKFDVGLSDFSEIPSEGIMDRMFPASDQVLRRELTRSTLTVLRNEGDIIPLKDLDKSKIASLCLGRGQKSSFQARLERYTDIEPYYIARDATSSQFDSLFTNLGEYDLVIIGVHNMDMRSSENFGLKDNELHFLKKIIDRQKTIVSIFGNPYSLDKILGIEKANGLICAYYDNFLAQDFAAQLVFGGIGANGRLPVDVNENFEEGSGIDVTGGIRFSYIMPEELGINGDLLKKKIDSICLSGIDSVAYPGCEVFAAKDGKVFFHECYGYHTYEKKQAVQTWDIFDIASVTKVSGPLPPLMRLYDERKVDLDLPFSSYWPRFRGTDKQDFTFREGLAHFARLAAWIPYYKEAKLKQGPLRRGDYKPDSSRRFSDRMAEDLWIRNRYKNTIYDEIAKSPLLKKKGYVYSGLLSYIYPELIANITGRNYEEYLYSEFFKPLGAGTLVYNPLRWFPQQRIVPTEYDNFFRMEQLRGYVHDEGAAMMGGISGNAGLFSTAEDLAKLHQMYLWEGFYGGKQFLSPEVLREFTRCQYCEEDNRRGLGFDKPLVGNDTLDFSEAYPAHSVSSKSFGHSGYTGTLVWADPESGLLFVFLSNRVYPTRENSRLYDLNIRSNILETFCRAVVNNNDEIRFYEQNFQ